LRLRFVVVVVIVVSVVAVFFVDVIDASSCVVVRDLVIYEASDRPELRSDFVIQQSTS
jgi:hypothetical protein